jgi:RNA polymerase sigma-70 factor (sigma-E family)
MAGRDPSYEAFVNHHVDDLFRAAVLITWDDAEAEDLVQECLMVVARRWPRVRTMERPGGYARKVLVNLAFDGTQRRARRRDELTHGGTDEGSRDHELLEIADAAAAATLDALTERAEMIEALGTLPRQQRLALVLRYYLDLSEAQAADMLGCSRGTVKSNTSRGIQHLREIFDPVRSRSEACET